MIVERFKPSHLEELMLQPAQEYARGDMEKKGYGEVLAKGDSFTGIIDGRIVVCAGVVPMWAGRGETWALIAGDIGKLGMRELHYAARRYLEMSQLRRIEAHCDASFKQAHRWLKLLGFQYEGPLAKYTPDGRDCLRFARIR